MNTSTVIAVAVALVVVAGLVALILRRRRYTAALREKGWTFDSRPRLELVLDLRVPPFGLGFDRGVDEAVTGVTRSGVGFRVLDYDCREGGPRFKERVAVLALPYALPELVVGGSTTRVGVRNPSLPVGDGLTVRGLDPAYAQTFLSPGVRFALDALAAAGHPVDLSVDGASLVLVGAPRRADDLENYLDLAAGVVSALDQPALSRWAGPVPGLAFAFYGHPDFVLAGTDDSLIQRYGLTTAASATGPSTSCTGPTTDFPSTASSTTGRPDGPSTTPTATATVGAGP